MLVIFIFTSSNVVTPYCTDFIIWINNSKVLITCWRIREGDYPLVNVHGILIVIVLKLLFLQSYIITKMPQDSSRLWMELSEWSASDYLSLLLATISAQELTGERALSVFHPFCNYVEKTNKQTNFLKSFYFSLTRQMINTHPQN